MPKTNKERLQDNNDRLEVIKTKVDDLPDYQDIEPIYSIANYELEETPWTVAGSVSSNSYYYYQKDDVLYMKEISGIGYHSTYFDVYKKINGEYQKIYNETKSGSGSYKELATVWGSDEDNIYFSFIQYYNFPTSLPVYQYNISTSTKTTYDTINFSSGVYNMVNLADNDNIVYGQTGYRYNYKTKTLTEVDMTKLAYMTTSRYVCKLLQSNAYQYNGDNKKVNYQVGDTVVTKTYADNVRLIDESHSKIIVGNTMYQLLPDYSLGNEIKTIDKQGTFYSIGGDFFANDTTYEILYLNDNNNFELVQSCSDVVYYNEDGLIMIKQSGDTNYSYVKSIQSGTKIIGYNAYGNVIYLNSVNIYSEHLLLGDVAYDRFGSTVIGSMPNNGVLNYTPSSSAQTIPAGYTSGGTVSAIDYSSQGALSPADTATAEEQLADLFGEGEE